MSTKYYKFEGKAAWTKIYEPDEYRGNKFWKMNFYPKNESVIQEIKDAGIQSKPKEDDGSVSGVVGTFFTFRRDVEKEFTNGLQKFHAPVIKNLDDELIVNYVDNGDGTFTRQGDPVLIGNGSDVEVELEVYETKRFGKGARLRSIKLINLIEYEPEELTENEVDEEKISESAKKNTSKVKW